MAETIANTKFYCEDPFGCVRDLSGRQGKSNRLGLEKALFAVQHSKFLNTELPSGYEHDDEHDVRGSKHGHNPVTAGCYNTPYPSIREELSLRQTDPVWLQKLPDEIPHKDSLFFSLPCFFPFSFPFPLCPFPSLFFHFFLNQICEKRCFVSD
jgi:hypothetical protein